MTVIQFIHKLWANNFNSSVILSSSSVMVSGPHALKMALGELFSIFRENSPEIFKMLVPKSYCTEYADIDPTCQISGFQNRLGKGTEFLPQTKFSNSFISAIGRCNPLIFQTFLIWFNIIHSLKYLRSITL